MNYNKLLIANRGEIALRIIEAARELEMKTVVVFATDDKETLPVKRADEAYSLKEKGPRAYLNLEKILEIGKKVTHLTLQGPF